jgi:hypothetical protein
VIAKRNLRLPLLDIFDLPDMHNSCPQRPTTTTAPQALALMNGEFALEQAQRWSGRLLVEHPDDLTGALRAALGEAFGRPASDEQIQVARQFLTDQAATIGQDGTPGSALPEPMPNDLPPAQGAALVDFCHALLNSNGLMFVD